MLTGDLLRVRIQQKELTPSFVDVEKPAMQERAAELVALYVEGFEKGWTRGRLQEEVQEIAADRTDHKLIKGLAKVLEDLATFETDTPIEPQDLRRKFYEAVGAAPSREAAAAAYLALSEELGMPVALIQRLLFADRKAEQQIVGFLAPGGVVPDGEWLLHRYNVSLVQATLRHCEDVMVLLHEPAPERLQQLFRAVKFHGLMYRVTPAPEGFALLLDGPTSLLRFSTRYGQSLANWFPTLLLQTCDWELKATVRWTRRRLRKDLNLSSALGLRPHIQDRGAYVTRTEEWFAERFATLDSGWTMAREGAVINLGGRGVICPDFTFRKHGQVAHLEIVGYWRKGWLESRLKLIAQHGPGNLVLAVSSKMEGAKQGLGGFKGKVVSFKEIVPSRDVLAALEEIAIPDVDAG